MNKQSKPFIVNNKRWFGDSLLLVLLILPLLLQPAPVSANGCYTCPCPDDDAIADDGLIKDPFETPADIGGVTLNKTLDFLNGVDEIMGAAYDPKRGEIIFSGQGEIQSGEQIDMNDLIVAVRSIYEKQEDPGVTFYTDPETMDTGVLNVTYYGATENTRFGKILYDADYLLKQLTLGIDPSGEPLTTLHTELGLLGYESFADKLINSGVSLGNVAVEMWFEPLTIAGEVYSEGASVFDKKSFVFSDMSMRVRKRLIDVNTNTEIPPNTYPVIEALAQEFADLTTTNYNEYSNISGFEVLKQLKRLGKITGLVRWLRFNDIPVDFSFMADYVPPPVDTEEKVDMLQVCRDHSNDGAWVNGACSIVGRIKGGVIYNLAYADFGKDVLQQHPEIINNAILSQNRVLNAQTADDMKWNYTANVNGVSTALIGMAQTVAQSAKDGQFDFNTVDLAFPNMAGQSMAFTRYYDSFSNISSGLGPGWSELPYSIRFPEARDYFQACLDVQCSNPITMHIHRDIILVDRIQGKTVQFQAADPPKEFVNSGTGTTEYRASYYSDKTNDIIYE